MSDSCSLAKRAQLTASRVVFSVFVFLLAVVILEVVLRSTHALGARISWAEPDEVLGYRYTPGASYWYLRENNRPIQGRINSFGWRDTEWSLEKPQGTIRVAVLGDSYVEAFQVETESTFLKRAEEQLNSKSGRRFELMNFGRSGFTQTEELIVLQDSVLRFSPDAVVLLFFPPNDITDISPETSLGGTRPYFRVDASGALTLDTTFSESSRFKLKKRINWFKRNSALISLAAERWVEFNIRRSQLRRAQGASATGQSARLRGYQSLYTDHPEESYGRNYELCKVLIREMSAICAAHGMQFILVCIDDVYIPTVEVYCRALDPSFDADFFDRDLREFAASINADYIGLQGAFRDHYRKAATPLHFGEFDPSTMNINGGHWNYEGHRVVADELARTLESQFLQPRAPGTGASDKERSVVSH